MAWLLLLVVLGGCAAETGSPAVGADPAPLWEDEARDVWAAHPELPAIPAVCPRSTWLDVSPAEFERITRLHACFGPPVPGTSCATAATVQEPQGLYTLFPGQPEGVTLDMDAVRFHEALHVLEGCTTGTMDPTHSDARVWLSGGKSKLWEDRP